MLLYSYTNSYKQLHLRLHFDFIIEGRCIKVNAREYLEQLEALDSKIQVDRQLLEEKKIKAIGGGAIRYDKDKVQSSLVGSRLESDVCDYVAFEQKIEQRIFRYEKAKEKIVDQIKALNVGVYIDILFSVYVQYKTLKETSDNMQRSYKFVKDKHGKALKAFEQMHKPLNYLS